MSLNLATGLALFTFYNGASSTGCTVITALTEYFLLVAFFWMFFNSLHLWHFFSKVFAVNYSKKYYVISAIIAYIVPAVLVGITIGVSYPNYAAADSCWLNRSNGVIWSFAAPVIVLMTGSIVSFFSVARIAIVQGARIKKAATEVHVKFYAHIRRIVVLSASFAPVMGIGWLFAILSFTANQQGLSSAFTVFNALQGILVFIFHICLDKEVQREWRNVFSRKRSSSFGSSSREYKKSLFELKKGKYDISEEELKAKLRERKNAKQPKVNMLAASNRDSSASRKQQSDSLNMEINRHYVPADSDAPSVSTQRLSANSANYAMGTTGHEMHFINETNMDADNFGAVYGSMNDDSNGEKGGWLSGQVNFDEFEKYDALGSPRESGWSSTIDW